MENTCSRREGICVNAIRRLSAISLSSSCISEAASIEMARSCSDNTSSASKSSASKRACITSKRSPDLGSTPPDVVAAARASTSASANASAMLSSSDLLWITSDFVSCNKNVLDSICAIENNATKVAHAPGRANQVTYVQPLYRVGTPP